MPRLATPADLDDVLRLADLKEYPDWPSQAPEETGPTFLRRLLTSPTWTTDYDLLVSPDREIPRGFLLLRKQVVRGITLDRDSIIEDWFAPDDELRRGLLEQAAVVARGNGSQFLTIEVSPADRSQSRLLESCGFELESHKIRVATGRERIPEGTPYTVRPIEPSDGFLVGVLASTVLEHTLSGVRERDLGELAFRSMSATIDQVAQPDTDRTGLVLLLGEEIVGYLLLALSEKVGYIADLALAREHWGGVAVRHLMRAGSGLLYDRGIPLFVGDVSDANRRALVVAQRALGFVVERQRHVRRL